MPDPQLPAFGQDVRPALAMDRAVDTASAEQRRIRRVHQHVGVLLGQVAFDEFDRGHVSSRSTILVARCVPCERNSESLNEGSPG
ncbi:hypothetical protein [Amycolatopsis sp. NPDC059021]|uniref:hypothetical protein n=1 Tax=Amycolatopsis sp. NPDC059021 TaxID=3346704 RepID=UPI00366C5C63